MLFPVLKSKGKKIDKRNTVTDAIETSLKVDFFVKRLEETKRETILNIYFSGWITVLTVPVDILNQTIIQIISHDN